MLRKVVVAFAVLVAVGYAVMRYELGTDPVPATSSYPLDLGAVRTLAHSLPGALPVAVNEELVAQASLPGAAVFAGESFAPHSMVHRVFQVLYPDGEFVLIDSAMGPEMAKKLGGEGGFDAAAWETVKAALPHAKWTVFTHEHADHIDGVARYPEPAELAASVRFNAAQLANTEALDDVAMPAELRTAPPLAVDPTLALAPGIVLIAAPGHTPGSQLVYVALAGGQEMLFIGDVAWHWRAIQDEIYRPHFVTDLFLHEDRAAVLAQFRRLKQLHEEAPDLLIVVSHDADQRQQLLDAGRIGPHFTAGPDASAPAELPPDAADGAAPPPDAAPESAAP